MPSVAGLNSHASGPLLAGPLLGECGPSSARVWAQGRDEQPLTLTLYPSDGAPRTYTARPALSEHLCVVFDVDGLSPGGRYEYELSSAAGTTPRYPLRAAPEPTARRLRLAFGSCYKDYKTAVQPIFGSILGESPDVFLLLGDTCYFDEDDARSEAAMMQAHLRNRNNDSLRPLLAAVPTLGIWDDHDFGPNDSDGSFSRKDSSLRAFRRMWAQRRFGLPELPGIFSSVRCGPAEIFLLDVRYHRRSRRHILGNEQWNWLARGLRDSQAAVKIIASGSQLLPEVAGQPPFGWECWHRDAPEELERFFGFLAESQVRGVLFLSGDPHLGYVLHQPGRVLGDGLRGPELYELTASPLANRPWATQVMPAESASRPRFDPTIRAELATQNYGVVDIDLDRPGAEIVLALKDSGGGELATQEVALAELAVRKQLPTLTAAVVSSERAYLFRGDQYVRVVPSSGQLEPGYPRSVGESWKGALPLSRAETAALGFDAVLPAAKQRLYFFAGNGYTRYDLARDRADAGYPLYIARHWKGLFAGDLCGVVPVGGAGAGASEAAEAYFFSASHCVRYDLRNDRAQPGYPRPLSDEFSGCIAAGERVRAAIGWVDGCIYFLCEDEWRCYDLAAGAAVPSKTHADDGEWLSFLA